MISFDDARQLLLAAVKPLAVQTIDLRDALGRVSAEQVLADADAVPFARSAMDGYAVRATDCSCATADRPVELPVQGRVFAEKGQSQLVAGSAFAIMTGAPLPLGADAVVPYEHTEFAEDAVRIFNRVNPGACVFPPAEDFRCGDELLAAGETIRPGDLALLAFAGKTRVRVFRQPRVAIVCTGNELVDPSARPEHGQIRNSNAVMLAGLVTESFGLAIDYGIVPDMDLVFGDLMENAKGRADLLVTSGGASGGERDIVKRVLKDRGAEFLFSQVAMRPGKPVGFALWNDLPVCVLPGNPVAAFVCFQELVRPALETLAGRRNTGLPTLKARLNGEVRSRNGRRYFVLGHLQLTPLGFVVTPLKNQCSALVRTAADANALVIVPESAAGADCQVGPGDSVEVHVLDWPRAIRSLEDLFPAGDRGALLSCS